MMLKNKLWKSMLALASPFVIATPLITTLSAKMTSQQTVATTKATVNPTTAYYVSKNLFDLNVWDDKTDQANSQNLTQFETLKTNLQASNDPNLGELKTKLEQIIDQVQGYHNYHQAKKEFEKFASSPDAPVKWDDIKEAVRQAYGNPPENWADFEDLKNINEQLLKISGITNENVAQIDQLSYTKLKTQDLLNSSTATDNSDNVADLAGSNYKFLAKIAILDPNKAGIYQLNFTLDDKQYHWIIDNRDKQLATSLANATDQLLTFGRLATYENLNNKPKELETFVLKKVMVDNGVKEQVPMLELMVRLKANENLKNITFSQPVNDQDPLLNPLNFGILDVQLNNQQTFQSLINNNGKTTKAGVSLIDKTNNAKDVENQSAGKIQFFNQSTSMSAAANNDAWQTSTTNQNLTWYAKANSDSLSFNLNLINTNETTTMPQFKPLYDVQSGLQSQLELGFNGDLPTLNNHQILINKTTFEKLPETIKTSWKTTSNLQLVAQTNKQIAKQTLSFNNHVWFIDFTTNNPTFSPDLTKNQQFVLNDLTNGIFFETPRGFDQQQPFASQTSKLVPTIGDLPNAIALTTIAKLFSQYNDPNSALAKLTVDSQLLIPMWNKAQEVNNLADVSVIFKPFSSADNPKTYHDLWNYLSAFISQAQGFLKQLFDQDLANQLDAQRYQNSDFNLIVNQWFNISNPFLINFNPSQVAFNHISTIVQSIHDPNQITQAQINALNHQAQNLINYQLEAIVNEFQALSFTPLYKQLVKLTSDQTKTNKTLVDPNQFHLLEQEQIKLVQINQTLKATTTAATLQQQMQNIVELLRQQDLDLTMAILGPIQRQHWNAYDATKLTTFKTTDHIATNFQKAFLWANLLIYFGYDLVSPYLNQTNFDPKGTIMVWDLNQNQLISFTQAIENLIKRLTTNQNQVKTLVAGFNIYQILNHKLNQISNGYQSPNGTISNQQLVSAINLVFANPIATNQQLSNWNLIINGDPNKISSFINQLSTKGDQFAKLVKTLNDDQIIIKVLNLVAQDWKRQPANPALIGIISGAILGTFIVIGGIGYLIYNIRQEHFAKYQIKPTQSQDEQTTS